MGLTGEFLLYSNSIVIIALCYSLYSNVMAMLAFSIMRSLWPAQFVICAGTRIFVTNCSFTKPIKTALKDVMPQGPTSYCCVFTTTSPKADELPPVRSATGLMAGLWVRKAVIPEVEDLAKAYCIAGI